MSPEMPRFVSDLYADLRDRRMLVPVAILAVAILAVPVLMKRDAPAPPPSAADAELSAEDMSMVPAVLASNPELRDYRERLEKLSSKNPFRERFASEAALGGGIEPIKVIGGSSGLATGSQSGSSSSGAIAPMPIAEPTSSVTPSTSSSSEPAPAKSEPAKQPAREKRLLVHRADVKVGPHGDLDRRRNVKALTVLPGKADPVLVFLGADEDSENAIFMVSSDVESTEGDGSCLPSTEDCQFLTLKAGEAMKLHYAPGDEVETFAIRLVEIRLVPVKSDQKGSDQPERRARVEDELAAWLGL